MLKYSKKFVKALTKRLDYFCSLGYRAADHGVDYIPFAVSDSGEADNIFANAMSGKSISTADADKYKTAIMLHLGREYAKRNIVMQLHYSVQRNTNTKMFDKIGPDTDFDCISTKNCNDEKMLGKIVNDICYNNAAKYFDI